MAVVEFRLPDDHALRDIAENMRPEDVAEVMASHGHTPQEAIETGVALSQYTIVTYMDGEPVCVFGLVKKDLLSGIGVPWMLGSTKVLKHKRDLMLSSREVISEMMTMCSKLYNHVHADNRLSIRYLKWLGFTIDDPEPIGVNGEMFHNFHMERVS